MVRGWRITNAEIARAVTTKPYRQAKTQLEQQPAARPRAWARRGRSPHLTLLHQHSLPRVGDLAVDQQPDDILARGQRPIAVAPTVPRYRAPAGVEHPTVDPPHKTALEVVDLELGLTARLEREGEIRLRVERVGMRAERRIEARKPWSPAIHRNGLARWRQIEGLDAIEHRIGAPLAGTGSQATHGERPPDRKRSADSDGDTGDPAWCILL